jgi:hypothetical protein
MAQLTAVHSSGDWKLPLWSQAHPSRIVVHGDGVHKGRPVLWFTLSQVVSQPCYTHASLIGWDKQLPRVRLFKHPLGQEVGRALHGHHLAWMCQVPYNKIQPMRDACTAPHSLHGSDRSSGASLP